jgi:hypothetical protein
MFKEDLICALSFDLASKADNFTVILLMLICKADVDNLKKLSLGFPEEVRAIDIYKNHCPYKDERKSVVDWDKIIEMAKEDRRDMSVEDLLKAEGWEIECLSPFEIRHEDGSFMCGNAANDLLRTLRNQ